MDSNFNVTQQLLQERADYQARLSLIPYDGSPEVKENSSGKYLYIRKRVNGRLTSTYVDVYSDDLYQLLLRNTKEVRELKKQIRRVDKELAANGYTQNELSPEVVSNLDFARVNMKSNIYDQAVLEGVATTFPLTHRGIGEKHMGIDILYAAIGHKGISRIPHVMRNHTCSWGDMNMVGLQIINHQPCTLEYPLIPTMKESYISAIRRELGMGDKVVFVCHILFRLKGSQLSETH